LIRHGAIVFAALIAGAGGARAETPLERGTYLMSSIVACGNCHTPQTPDGPAPGMELAGGLRFDEGFGTAFAPNITPDFETGVGKWSDAQIVAAIREGRRPDGTIIGPPMPILLYRGLSDDDVKAIVAYLRSVKRVANKVARSNYTVPLPPAYGPPVVTVAAVPKDDRIAYGAYLAGPAAHCIECHSTPGANGAPDFINKTGGGGMSFNGPWGVSHAANITPNGIGTWSDADIRRAITTGVRPDGVHLKGPMGFAYYRNMATGDLDAIIAYLRTLKPM
jgi:mono/diheme cytochrome c family protein